MKIITQLLVFIFSFLMSFIQSEASSLSSASYENSLYKISLKSHISEPQRGEKFWVLLQWELKPNWYIYAQDPGDGGMPPELIWKLPKGLKFSKEIWPTHQDLSKNGMTIYGYQNKAFVLVEFDVLDEYTSKQSDKLEVDLKWAMCQNECRIETAQLTLNLPAPHTFQLADYHETMNHSKDFALYELLGALVFAFLGGLILNLMPCVLPVLSLKILDIIHASQENLKLQALSYSVGTIVGCLILSIVVNILRLAGEKIGWGFQLQSPVFVSFLACAFLGFALNLFGVFEIGLWTTRLQRKNHLKTSNASSFLNGIFACLVATPCSAPFMGTAIASGLSQPFWMSSLIFMFLGLGLSFPFLVISIQPKLSSFLPRPGSWMISFKQIMGFFMLASVGWMLWILESHFPEQMIYLLAALWLCALAFWFYGKFLHIVRNSFKKKFFLGTSMALFSAVFLMFYFLTNGLQQDELNWQPYDFEKIKTLQTEKKPYLIKFTARWCITCQTNDLIFKDEQIKSKIKQDNIQLFVADWTHHRPEITKALQSYGHSSIPLLVYYSTKQEKSLIMSSFLTVSHVLKQLYS